MLSVLLTAIPWLGGTVNWIAILLGLAASWSLGREILRQQGALSDLEEL